MICLSADIYGEPSLCFVETSGLESESYVLCHSEESIIMKEVRHYRFIAGTTDLSCKLMDLKAKQLTPYIRGEL